MRRGAPTITATKNQPSPRLDHLPSLVWAHHTTNYAPCKTTLSDYKIHTDLVNVRRRPPSETAAMRATSRTLASFACELFIGVFAPSFTIRNAKKK